ncbi:hypothetical protein [Paenibacillus sp. J22TS3]|uniref:hypothetical protein n=1 Tax=Paenibacillus sp. J22TS3 TaxID=2807192 RepID=UPI001BCB96EC|nr:hypothetical protein [Paenibacillus sp. J22TS3]
MKQLVEQQDEQQDEQQPEQQPEQQKEPPPAQSRMRFFLLHHYELFKPFRFQVVKFAQRFD